jgi:selenocysteine lyase/cysteine desulfurase
MNQADRGVETRRIPASGGRVDVARLLEACDDRTRILALSWVGYSSGWRVDVGEIVEAAHRRGILVFLDAIQGLGVFPLDVQQTGVDFLAADGHKWMLGPEGAGIFYLRRDHLDRIRPTGVGWNSVVHAFDFSRCELNLRPAATRFEGGSQNMVGFHGLAASLKLLQQFGLTPHRSPLAERVLALTDYAAARLSERGARIVSPREATHRSGILVFEIPGQDDHPALRNRCLQEGIVLSVRGGGLRISPHAYNHEEDIDRLVDVVTRGEPTRRATRSRSGI